MKAPAVNRSMLLLMAGLLWTLVGLALCSMAVYWMVTAPGNWIAALTVGLIAGAAVYYFGFRKLADKNKIRLREQAPGKGRVCLFAFQSWRSYIIIVIMMALGYTLRHLPIGRMYLVPIYLAIGTGLLLASLLYYIEV